MRISSTLFIVRDAEHALELCETASARDFLFATIKGRHPSRWHALLAQVERRAPTEAVSGRSCVVDLEAGADESTREVVRSIGRTLLEAGAASVTVWGRPVVLQRSAA